MRQEDVNKLRIGDLVIYNGTKMRIYSIIGPHPYENDKEFNNKTVLDLYDGAGLLTCTIDDIDPVGEH